MKNKLFKIYLVLVLSLSSLTMVSAQCDGDNTFIGAVSNQWSLAANWSELCVPGSDTEGEIAGTIRILVNCNVPPEDRANIKFSANAILIIGPDAELSNNSSGTWTITNIEGEGTYVGHISPTRSIKPGFISTPVWTCGQTISYGGQEYLTKLFGTQCWMVSNLNIGIGVDNSIPQIANDIVEKYCYDNLRANCNTYGGLYQWSEAMQYLTVESTRGICPVGFHIPSDDDWKILELHLGMTPIEVDQLGFRGTSQGSQLADNEPLWLDGALDQHMLFGSIKFNALPAGIHSASDGQFFELGSRTTFWTSSSSLGNPFIRGISFNATGIQRRVLDQADAFSIRCVLD